MWFDQFDRSVTAAAFQHKVDSQLAPRDLIGRRVHGVSQLTITNRNAAIARRARMTPASLNTVELQ